jgi:hypothetical protein
MVSYAAIVYQRDHKDYSINQIFLKTLKTQIQIQKMQHQI